jgi:hypothetical protein
MGARHMFLIAFETIWRASALPFSAVKMRTDDLAGSNRALGV